MFCHPIAKNKLRLNQSEESLLHSSLGQRWRGRSPAQSLNNRQQEIRLVAKSKKHNFSLDWWILHKIPATCRRLWRIDGCCYRKGIQKNKFCQQRLDNGRIKHNPFRLTNRIRQKQQPRRWRKHCLWSDWTSCKSHRLPDRWCQNSKFGPFRLRLNQPSQCQRG